MQLQSVINQIQPSGNENEQIDSFDGELQVCMVWMIKEKDQATQPVQRWRRQKVRFALVVKHYLPQDLPLRMCKDKAI